MTMTAEITIWRLAARFDEEYPDATPEWVAERAARSIPARERLGLLTRMLAQEIDDRRRARARAIERQATERVEYEAFTGSSARSSGSGRKSASN
jgi:hypothetical protein